jgi:CO dehydrogenase maturation factor
MCDTCGGHGPNTARHDHADHHAQGVGARLVVVGKGGVGKSTVTALLARLSARRGLGVVAVDADEQQNLAATLGIGLEDAAAIVAVAADADYVEEKTGARPGEGAGAMLRLNPDTADIVDRRAVEGPDGVRLLVMGGVREAGGGCLCPETALIQAAVAGMHLHPEDVVLMDTHAGVEHFGRSLARGFDAAVVVVDPTFNAVQVGRESAVLADGLGIGTVHLVVNRARSQADVDRALAHMDRLGGFPFASVTVLPFDELALECEPAVDRLLEGSALAGAVAALSGELLAGVPGRVGVGA